MKNIEEFHYSFILLMPLEKFANIEGLEKKTSNPKQTKCTVSMNDVNLD